MFLSLLLNIILILSPAKKVSETSFCSSFKKHVSFACAFKIFRPFFFLQSRNKVFHNQETFSQPRNLFTIKKRFHNQGTFPQTRNFSTFKKPAHSQGTFAPSIKISTVKENFHKIFYLIKEIFCKQ